MRLPFRYTIISLKFVRLQNSNSAILNTPSTQDEDHTEPIVVHVLWQTNFKDME